MWSETSNSHHDWVQECTSASLSRTSNIHSTLSTPRCIHFDCSFITKNIYKNVEKNVSKNKFHLLWGKQSTLWRRVWDEIRPNRQTKNSFFSTLIGERWGEVRLTRTWCNESRSGAFGFAALHSHNWGGGNFIFEREIRLIILQIADKLLI